MAIAVVIGRAADAFLSIVAACFGVLIAIHLIGLPLYLFDKLLKSPFASDVLLPFKLIFKKFREARLRRTANVRHGIPSAASHSDPSSKR